MKYIFKLENLDCANCAAKAEAAVAKLEGVKACAINFFALKMTLETESEMTPDFLKTILKTMKKVESDVKITQI